MTENPSKSQADEALRRALPIIYFALMSGVVVIALVMTFVMKPMASAEAGGDNTTGLIGYALAAAGGLSILGGLAAAILSRTVLTRSVPEGHAADRILKISLISGAMMEGGGILGAMTIYLSGNVVLGWSIVGAALFFMMTQFPWPGRFDGRDRFEGGKRTDIR